MSVDLRQNVRANLSTPVILQGSDRFGQKFQVQGETVDFSRQALGLLIAENLVAPGSVVAISVPKRFSTDAIVQWTKHDAETGKIRIGVRMIGPKTSIGLRVAASLLLCVALLSQASFGRSRGMRADNSCTMGLAQMKSILEDKLGQWSFVTSSEKAFVHVIHQQASCEEYTRLYEKSNFYAEKNKRAAVSRWHWNQYHSKDEAIRTAAVSGLGAILAGGAE